MKKNDILSISLSVALAVAAAALTYWLMNLLKFNANVHIMYPILAGVAVGLIALFRKRVFASRAAVVAIVAVALGLIAGAILMAVIGGDPWAGYLNLAKGGLNGLARFGDTFGYATQLVLTGLSVAFAFRTGLFNIGGAGQMLMGGLAATCVALWLPLPKALVIPVMFVAAVLGGALWAAVPGVLKARFNVHEVVTTIMMNWVAYWAVYYFIPAYLKGGLETESMTIPETASLKVPWLGEVFGGSGSINLGIFIAAGAMVLIWFILNRTVLGYELKAVGFNRHAAEYAGMPVNRNIALSMMIAGALAGLAGLTQYTGYAANMMVGSLPSQGYDGIAVALLGANSPWGVGAAAVFFGILQSGKGFMSAMTEVPPDIADTIIAVIIYFAATSVLIERVWDRFKRRRAQKTEGGAVQHVGNR